MEGESGARTPLLWPHAASVPIELPLPEGTAGGEACSVNDAGVVIGRAYNPQGGSDLVAWKVYVANQKGLPTASVRDTETILVEEPGMGGVYGSPELVNSGFVGVTLYDAELASLRAVRLRLVWSDDAVWEVANSRTQLFDGYGTVNGINEAGMVCGRCAPPEPGGWGIAYVMDLSGNLLDLPHLRAIKVKGVLYGEASNEEAHALNNRTPPQIVGRGARLINLGNYYDSEKVPLRWDGEAGVTDVRTVTEGSSDFYEHELYDINDAGWITARTKDASGMPVSPAVLIPD